VSHWFTTSNRIDRHLVIAALKNALLQRRLSISLLAAEIDQSMGSKGSAYCEFQNSSYGFIVNWFAEHVPHQQGDSRTAV
jgi:hypothetical protein